MIVPPLRIVLEPKSGFAISLPENPNAVQVDLAWACLRCFRTGEYFEFRNTSELELLAFAEAEREYSRQREEGC